MSPDAGTPRTGSGGCERFIEQPVVSPLPEPHLIFQPRLLEHAYHAESHFRSSWSERLKGAGSGLRRHLPCMNDDELLLRAIELAETGNGDGMHGPFGAVVARRGVVVGEGWNQVVALGDPTAHAEIMAIRAAAARLGTHALEGCTIYCSCEPCPMCLGAVYWARIGRVVYACSAADAREAGFDDAAIHDEMARPWSQRRIVAVPRLRERGLRAFTLWADNPDRVEY